MKISLQDLETLLKQPEGQHLEFKEAKENFHFEKLVQYCAALANEGGGRIVLGVSDKRPRQVVGSRAFEQPERTLSGLVEQLRLKVETDEIAHPQGRVLIFSVPRRPLGMPIDVRGTYWMRAGEALRPMTSDELRRILMETGPDFSSEICPGASLGDLNTTAVQNFITLWKDKSRKPAEAPAPIKQSMEDAELLVGGKVTYAALILFGTRMALGRYLGQAEVIFEYRSSEASIPYQQREEFREGFFEILDSLWNLINLRNEVQSYEDGLFVRQISTFNERAVREAILNAVTHRDYRLAGSIFVRQYPRKLEIVSPGGLPSGITLENILERQSPRNRRVAEACARCRLVERSGQGIDLIFREHITDGKAVPGFAGTDDYQVAVTLLGEVQNHQFLQFLQRIGQEQQASFETGDLIVLDRLQHEEEVPGSLRLRLAHLTEQGIVERIGRGKGVRYILSKKFYSFLGRKGQYTRAKGLDRSTQKELLVRHIREAEPEGARLSELQDVLKELSRKQVQTLLRELREEGRISVFGLTNAGRWHLATT